MQLIAFQLFPPSFNFWTRSVPGPAASGQPSGLHLRLVGPRCSRACRFLAVLADAVRHPRGDSLDGCSAGVRLDGFHQTAISALAGYRPPEVGKIVNQGILGVRHGQTGMATLALWFEALGPENRSNVEQVEVQSCHSKSSPTLPTGRKRAGGLFSPLYGRWYRSSHDLSDRSFGEVIVATSDDLRSHGAHRRNTKRPGNRCVEWQRLCCEFRTGEMW